MCVGRFSKVVSYKWKNFSGSGIGLRTDSIMEIPFLIFCLNRVIRQLFENFEFDVIRLKVLQYCESQDLCFSQLLDSRYITAIDSVL